ncbi:MAG TPA: nuclear transport factor 2 family protein [Candidatus Sulfotelmatobacter sp.]|jgi:ketosteroid isomerase-like protein
MSTSSANLDLVRRYLKSIEDGSFSSLAEMFSPHSTIEQLPNLIYPQGVRHNVGQMSEGFDKGRRLLSSQTYEIRNAVVNGSSVAVEVLWTGTLAVAFGNLAPGSRMRAHSAMFFEFQDGKIAGQRNYDCFEPW